jgi:hypothetical protein
LISTGDLASERIPALKNRGPKKSILIATYHFFPENAPRAFRATELAKQLVKEGHAVTVYLPQGPADYSAFLRTYPLEIIRVPTGFLFNRRAKSRPSAIRQWEGMRPGRRSVLRSFLKFFFNLVYMGGEHFEFCIPLFWRLAQEKRRFDLILSNALPFGVHVGVWAALWVRPHLAKVRVAEYGDPFAANPQSLFPRWYGFVESIILRKFKYLVVPTAKAIPSFIPYKPLGRIKIIPQGMDLGSIRKATYRKNKTPTFGYAGLFYSKIRHPLPFIEFLGKIKGDFRLVLFTDQGNADNMACVGAYQKILGNKLEVHGLLSRKECVRRLSRMDFLLNVDFHPSDKQLPSKLIDYALAGRPVFNLNQKAFDRQVFMRYWKGDFSGYKPQIKLGDYDVRKTTQALLDLIP